MFEAMHFGGKVGSKDFSSVHRSWCMPVVPQAQPTAVIHLPTYEGAIIHNGVCIYFPEITVVVLLLQFSMCLCKLCEEIME